MVFVGRGLSDILELSNIYDVIEADGGEFLWF